MSFFFFLILGVHDSGEEGVFKETNDDVIKFSNWNGGEPNDVNSEDCTEILSGNGLWNDMPCYWSLPYICEKQKGTYTFKRGNNGICLQS